MQRKSLAIALGLLLTAGWAFAEGQTDRLSFTTDEHMTISWGGLTSDMAEEPFRSSWRTSSTSPS